MSNTVSATFKSSSAAREVLVKLGQHGFTEKQVSVVATDSSVGTSFNIERDTKAAEGGAFGAAAGGLLGIIAGTLGATGAIVIPGVNLVITGTLIAAAAAAGVGGAVGGLAGALIGLGIPEFEAKRYEDEVKNGAVLIVVDAENAERADVVKELFEREDAYNNAA